MKITSWRNTKPLFLLLILETLLILGIFSLIFSMALTSEISLLGLGDLSEGQLFQAAISSIIIVTMMYCVGLYAWQWLTSIYQLISRLLVGFFISLLILVLYIWGLTTSDMTLTNIASGVAVAYVTALALRLLVLRVMKDEAFKRQVIVIGAGSNAASIAELEAQPQMPRFRCVGFMPTKGEDIEVAENVQINKEDLIAAAENRQVDEIVIAVIDRRNKLPLEALVDCRLSGIMVSDYQTFCEKHLGRIDLGRLTPSWFFFVGGFRNGNLQHGIKRVFDLLMASALLLIFSPIMVLVAIAIKLEDFGPLFYCQERVGYRGRNFVICKFRSMRVNAEAAGKPEWASKNDSRITKVGAFIRRTRMDELPQLFNVLAGNMSIVGPRPERPYFVDRLKKDLPYYNERHRVKPGITGWAQVNFDYGGSVEDAKRKTEFDLYYIKYFSIFLDLIIILQTVRVVLWSEGSR